MSYLIEGSEDSYFHCTKSMNDGGCCLTSGLFASEEEARAAALNRRPSPEAGWVSVQKTDELPNTEETVLQWVVDEVGNGACISGWMEEAPKVYDAEEWPPDGASFPSEWTGQEWGEVTHWRPVPAGPEGEAE